MSMSCSWPVGSCSAHRYQSSLCIHACCEVVEEKPGFTTQHVSISGVWGDGPQCTRHPHRVCAQGNTGKGRDRGAVALQQAYLRVIGLEEELQGSHSLPTFSWAPCRLLAAHSASVQPCSVLVASKCTALLSVPAPGSCRKVQAVHSLPCMLRWHDGAAQRLSVGQG